MSAGLRVGLVSEEDARSRASWSGTLHHMARALETMGAEVVHLRVEPPLPQRLGRLRSGVSYLLGRGKLPWQHTPRLARAWGRRLTPEVERARVDVLFAPAASTQIADLETSLPIVYTSDATFDLLADYYPRLRGVDPAYRDEAVAVERRALHRASVLLYPSAWAADSAIHTYDVPADRVVVAPYGANLDPGLVPDDLPAGLAEARRGPPVRLLFLGVDWERKGGAVAVDAVRRLRERGVEAELTVCGCRPPRPLASWVRVVGRLDKRVVAEERALVRLLLESAFLVLPTRRECFGIVFCEASALGTPSLAPRTGGVPGAVIDGDNGRLLPEGSGGEAYADAVQAILDAPGTYERLVASSRRRWEETHSWARWGAVAASALDRAAAGRTG